MGDFLGFSFGGVSSQSLGITRVSNGDRYDDELHPEIKDITVEVPGVDGEYYFGSDYGTKTIDLEFAFDHLTEKQFRMLRQTYGTKEIKQLIFDEWPYKYYLAKLASPVELSYVCFDEPKRTIGAERDGVRRITRVEEETVIDEETGESTTQTVVYRDLEQVTPYVQEEGTERIYKGEGKISFICYYPFAKSVYKTLPVGNEEWASSSGMFTTESYIEREFDVYKVKIDATTEEEVGVIGIYNAGDIPTGFRLYCPFDVSTSLRISYRPDRHLTDSEMLRLNIGTITSLKNSTGENDIGFLVNTSNGLIQGVQFIDTFNNEIITSGNIYNRYVTSGYFFKLEPTDPNRTGLMWLTDGNGDIIDTDEIKIFYDYLYF